MNSLPWTFINAFNMVWSPYHLNFKWDKITLDGMYIIFQNLRSQSKKTLLFLLKWETLDVRAERILFIDKEMQVTRSIIYCSGLHSNSVAKNSPELRQSKPSVLFLYEWIRSCRMTNVRTVAWGGCKWERRPQKGLTSWFLHQILLLQLKCFKILIQEKKKTHFLFFWMSKSISGDPFAETVSHVYTHRFRWRCSV